ncbi:hypothetical protein OG547_03105 [Streptomyces longwoodensis]|uniref:hypothetical protein n=1 Tax=Streptomyces longwoodensis TaxID=68231 RepID=UPI002ED3B7B4|nr:hypothetical protein OG547_03105 [Streptomyces longwoodensis]
MTTRSPSVPSYPAAIPASEVSSLPSSPPEGLPAADAVRGPLDLAGADTVDGLVRAAVVDRPLEEVAELITLLEQSPEHAGAVGDALRAAGVNRSVDDVARLVTLLTQPPRPADGADEVIRAAAERRPVEDVTRLMELLRRAALEPHCEQEAVRAAATRRPVGELVDLIGRLSRPEPPQRTVGPFPAPEDDDLFPAMHAEEPYPPQVRPRRERTAAAPRPARGAEETSLWPGRLAGALLVLCCAAFLPLHAVGATGQAYGIALGASVLCGMLAMVLLVRPALAVLAGAVVVAAVLAAGELLVDRMGPSALSDVVRVTAAPPWLAGAVAVCAALAALSALLLAFQQPLPRAVPVRPELPAETR